jgi:CTP synthase (UTP-ammonia lyase)
MKRARIAVVGGFDPGKMAHQAIEACFRLAQNSASLSVERKWIATQSIVPGDECAFRYFQCFWCAPGSP